MNKDKPIKLGSWQKFLIGGIAVILIAIMIQSVSVKDQDQSILGIITGKASDTITVKNTNEFLFANKITPVIDDNLDILTACSYTYLDFNTQFNAIPNTFIKFDSENKEFVPYVANRTTSNSCTDLTVENLGGVKLTKLEGAITPFTVDISPNQTLETLLTSRGANIEKCTISESDYNNNQKVFTISLKNENSTDNCTQFSNGFNGYESRFYYNEALAPDTLLYVRSNPDSKFYVEGTIVVLNK